MGAAPFHSSLAHIWFSFSKAAVSEISASAAVLPSFTELLENESSREHYFGSGTEADGDEEMGNADAYETLVSGHNSDVQNVISDVQAVVQSIIESSSSSRPMERYAQMLERALSRDSRDQIRSRSGSAEVRDAKLFVEICDQLKQANAERVVVTLVGDPVREVSETAQIVLRRMSDLAAAPTHHTPPLS